MLCMLYTNKFRNKVCTNVKVCETCSKHVSCFVLICPREISHLIKHSHTHTAPSDKSHLSKQKHFSQLICIIKGYYIINLSYNIKTLTKLDKTRLNVAQDLYLWILSKDRKSTFSILFYVCQFVCVNLHRH